MRPIFFDTEFQAAFERDGYVILPFLNEEEIRDLRRQYESLDRDLNKGFHATMHSSLPDYRRKVSRLIAGVFKPKADRLLDRFVPLVANYTVKEPGPESFFDFHLDWNMVDERRFLSLTIWCPLEDTNPENGNLWVMKGSHKLGNTIRCGPGLYLYPCDTAPEEVKEKYEKVVLSMKAGTAVIYDHRLFHGSPPNMTGKARIAINQAMMPAECTSWHYHWKEGKILAYAVDPDFYDRYLIGTEPADVPKVEEMEIKWGFMQQEKVNGMSYEKDLSF
jgi:hypothetical protein